jgi:hypothetical protein
MYLCFTNLVDVFVKLSSFLCILVVSIHGDCSKTGPATLLALDGVEESLAARDSQVRGVAGVAGVAGLSMCSFPPVINRGNAKSPTIWRFTMV